ncbi:MAG: hypothetical protein HC882_08090, partial [Acidobacteria bacterium]|nr:hypothetical protein [Acidobacteriota bacterium]
MKKNEPVGATQELDGARADISRRPCRRERELAQSVPRRVVDDRRWRFLNQLLMTPLDRAFAFPEVHTIAVPVEEHLNFDVARAFDESLDIDGVVAKTRFRLGARAFESTCQLRLGANDAHALPAAARSGLDHRGN